MGVHGLWKLLETTGKPLNPETLEGKILAVDISIWLNQAVKGVRDREGISVQNAHLLTLFNRICKLLFFRIRPVFVFDGDAPVLKKQTLALRRQRREELTSQSKQTNEKLLKTFLKRQAIKAALGDHSKEPLPSLSNVRRNEVDDIYVLPALPPAEEVEKSSSEEEEEDKEGEKMVDSFQTYQAELYDDPNLVDINSEDFSSLPPEMKHEMLKEMKEFCKRRRTMFNKPPERSGDFSQYQLAGLLQRNRLNLRLEGVEKEMSQLSAGGAPQLAQLGGDQQNHSMESNRLVSEEHSHYILIKGSKKNEPTLESRSAAAPWSESSLSSSRKGKAHKPVPLWRPVNEEEEEQEEEVRATCSEASKPSVSNPSQHDASPPSPRTLKAIQAAMSDSSDEEKGGPDNADGKVSPRTLFAIQQAITEEEEEEEVPSKLQTSLQSPIRQVVISSSDEETPPSPKEKSDAVQQSLHNEDSLLGSSSEDELEEVIGERNKAFRSAALQPSPKTEFEAANQNEQEVREYDHKLHASNQELSISPPSAPCRQEPSTETKTEHKVLDKSKETSIEGLEETNVDEVNSENSQESDSEESFIEVSGEPLKAEDGGDSAGEEKILKEVQKDETKNKEQSFTRVALSSDKEEETESKDLEKEVTEEKESKPTEAENEWEQLNMDELETLESSLQLEQSNLKEQKQQQERMANTVTGQMYLESQVK